LEDDSLIGGHLVDSGGEAFGSVRKTEGIGRAHIKSISLRDNGIAAEASRKPNRWCSEAKKTRES
jgi:hypothetical protein